MMDKTIQEFYDKLTDEQKLGIDIRVKTWREIHPGHDFEKEKELFVGLLALSTPVEDEDDGS